MPELSMLPCWVLKKRAAVPTPLATAMVVPRAPRSVLTLPQVGVAAGLGEGVRRLEAVREGLAAAEKVEVGEGMHTLAPRPLPASHRLTPPGP